jgi:REP element-mobilizing transposase RayT
MSPAQLPLDLSGKPRERRGGVRRHAGRKRTLPGRPHVAHVAREAMQARFPVHITKRIRTDVGRLRRFELCKFLRRAFVNGCVMKVEAQGGMVVEFRLCQFSIQGNHIHLICEAITNNALSRGVQGWSVRVAKAVNQFLERGGAVFEDRYHMEILRTPSQVRNCLCYVLQNARRHGEQIDPRFHGVDPFSSAWWFDGWKDAAWREGMPPPEARTVAEAGTWLLRVGWKRSPLGLIAVDEVRAAGRPRPSRRRACA